MLDQDHYCSCTDRLLFHCFRLKDMYRFGLFMIPYLVIGYDILKKAWQGYFESTGI